MTSNVSNQSAVETPQREAEFSDVVAAMVKIRERREARKKEFEAADKRDKEMYEKGEAWLLKHLHDHALSNIGTETHTVFANDQLMASIGDRNALIEHIKSSGDFDLLENRVSSKAVKTYMEENNGELPPGVSSFTKRKINIRRK